MSITIDNVNYTYSGTSAIVTGTSVTAGIPFNGPADLILVIQPTITVGSQTYNVISISDYAFSDKKNLLSCSIPNSITSIGTQAFNNCSYLTSLTIPSGVTSIGDSAFAGCSDLASPITIPSGISSTINPNLFSGCSKIPSVTFANSSTVYTIGDSCFSNCSSLTYVKLPTTLSDIQSNAFADCSSLTSITIPKNVSFISSNAFYDCTKLASVFFENTSNTPFTMNNSFENIASPSTAYVLSGVSTSSITDKFTIITIYYPSVPTAITIDNLNYIYSETTATVTGTSSTATNLSLIIPSSITVSSQIYNVVSINNNAFENKTNIISCSISDSVTSIGLYAFSGCSALTSIAISRFVTSIDYYAFSVCSKLASLTVDALNPNYSSLNNVLFDKNKTNLLQYPIGIVGTTYTIPNTVTNIDEGVFVNSKLQSVIFANPNIITSIGRSAFWGCAFVTSSITIPSSVTNIGDFAFYNCRKLTSLTVDALNPNYSSLNNVLFNKNKTQLLQYAIGQLNTTYTIPNTVTNILPGAFGQSVYLKSIAIPTTVTNIDRLAFINCSVLTSITIPSGVTSIGEKAFQTCSNLTSSITIPSGVTILNNFVFNGCAKIPSIIFASSNTVMSIGEKAFYGLTELISITIPSSVTNIGISSFDACTKLSSVTFAHTNSTPTIGNLAFNNIASPSTAYVLSSVSTTSITGKFTTISIYYPSIATSNKKLDVFLLAFTDVQRNIGTIGTFTGDYANYTALSKYDANLYYGADLSTWQSSLKFKTDGSIDVQEESVILCYTRNAGLLGKSGVAPLDYTNSTCVGCYRADNTRTILPDKSNVVYTKYKTTDFSASIDYPDDPAAAMNFLQLLAKGVFGSVQAVDMFSNENELALAYAETVERAQNYAVGLLLQSDVEAYTTGNNIADGQLNNSVKFIQNVFSYMMSVSEIKARFSMTYKAVVTTGTFTSENNIAIKLNGVATTATVDVFMDDSNNVNRIGVRTSTNANTFAKNNVVTIEQASSGAVITITLNSVQAAMLNGKLNEPTELPLEAGDIFHINMYPINNSNQMTAANKLIGGHSSAGQIKQNCDFHIQLMA